MTVIPVRPTEPLPLVAEPADPTDTPGTPHLRLDVTRAVRRYRLLARLFGRDAVHYAVKANPHPDLVLALAAAGCHFDVASPGEVAVALAARADPGRLLYSNPVKRRDDVASAATLRVRRFVADSASEVVKISHAAPGAEVLIRLATSGLGSDWPLSGKFGCAVEDLVTLLGLAADRGLDPVGIAFHVGSQQRDPGRWEPPIAEAARAWREAATVGVPLRVLDVGGGFPADHEGEHPRLVTYRDVIVAALDRHFGRVRPELVIEPGRGLVGDAGWVVSEVLGVSWRAGRRWVYLDVGVYTGLVETLGESIRYRLDTTQVGGPCGPVVLAGPTCDSVDVLYEQNPVHLPLSLGEGDRVVFRSAGAYTSSYSTVGFNGFSPLPTVLGPVPSAGRS